MTLTKEKLIKLKDTQEYGWIQCSLETTVDIRKVGILERKTKIYNVKLENIETIRMHYVEVIKDTLKEGDYVICKVPDVEGMIYGMIGEINSTSLYLWNNTHSGGGGSKKIKGFSFSWHINLFSKKAKILILKDKITEVLHCFGCNKELEFDERLKGADNENYCEDCWDNKFNKCVECDATIWQDDAKYSSNNDGPYCKNCYDDKYRHCNGCDCELEIEGDDTFTAEDEYWCCDCYHDRFGGCDSCGTTHRQDELIYDEENEETLCSRCHTAQQSKDIHDYGYRPTPEFKKEKWEEDFYLGIELEVLSDEYGKKSNKFIKFLDKLKVADRFYLKNDGSLGGEGFEIVSQPETLQSIHKNIKWMKILEWLTKNDFESEENGKCGIHIHINKAILEELDITKLRLFFKVNEKQLILFSKRGGENDYAKFDKKSVKEIIAGTQDTGRYNAINLNSSRETIELRLFRGSLDYERVLSILQFSDAIVRFVKKVGITCFLYGEGIYRNNSWRLFVDWCKEENRYKTLIKHLEKENLSEVDKICV